MTAKQIGELLADRYVLFTQNACPRDAENIQTTVTELARTFRCAHQPRLANALSRAFTARLGTVRPLLVNINKGDM